jgi:hypothetical protein
MPAFPSATALTAASSLTADHIGAGGTDLIEAAAAPVLWWMACNRYGAARQHAISISRNVTTALLIAAARNHCTAAWPRANKRDAHGAPYF